MIITNLIGGLGNQLFQYAIGLNLAKKNASSLKLDNTIYYNLKPEDTQRIYELDKYNISAKVATADEINSFKPSSRKKATFKRTLGRFNIALNDSIYIAQQKFTFDPRIANAQGNIYLEGYWQSYKYFENIKDIISSEFSLREKPDKKNQAALDLINKKDSVCLHVRRGDYVSNKIVTDFHGLTQIDYYLNSAKTIEAKVKKPTYFIFSDDQDWVKKNLKLKNEMVFVDHNGPDKGSEDLRLMSHCKHFVIANSSFSWWAAWLGSDPNKIVIAPKQWFANTHIDTRDLIPIDWIRK